MVAGAWSPKVRRISIRLLIVALAWLAAGSAEARTRIRADVDLRNDRPRITRFRRVRRYGWHSGLHYAPYVDANGVWRVGWHRGTHKDWYVIDVPVLDKIDRADWEVYARLGKGKRLRVRGDVNRSVHRATVVAAPRGTILSWLTPSGAVISGGTGSVDRRIIGDGWAGTDVGNSIIMMDLPGAPGTEIYLKRRTRDLVPAKPESAEEARKRLEQERRNLERDRLLDLGDQRFARGLYPQAALLYQKAMKLDRTDAIARFAVAHSLFALGVYKTAGRNARLALDRFPDWGLVKLELPKFYKAEATFFDKLAELEKYVGANPGDADARLLLGYCYYFSGRRQEALAHFNRLAAQPGGDKHAELFVKLAKYEAYLAKPDAKEK